MDRQVIITLSREFGSGGHEIALKLSQELGLKMYDRSMLDEIAEKKNINVDDLGKHDEKPRNPLLSRRVGEHSSSMEDHVANMQFEFLKDKAESGESFVVVGRCSETILRDYPTISFFVLGDKNEKLKRIMELYDLDEADALSKIKRHDRKRKSYHNAYSDFKWGDSRGYDLCINSSRLGIEKTIDLMKEYIKIKTK